ncbi:hypothetical protein J8J14_08920 [Roseomonas sp. SSH11]|uniref:Uncharacterized protein n=1 Tax=Pararoseomonas baculiformis TaxID=2820812 RepID=A0ABS4AD09_9PROT|nr:hypothetical protein [Pararoseomonas baculiformis]MBP0444905.1 hypothetical protein [Pararoseomonas baculiformis]
MLDSELVTRLAIPGLPEWSGLVVLLLGLLFLAAFLMMPFSVFGLKSRLDAIEAQLDDVQQEIRSLALRLPEPAALRRRPAAAEEIYDDPPILARPEPAPREDRAPRMTPPIPPPPTWPEAGPRDAGRRMEPRLGGPRR